MSLKKLPDNVRQISSKESFRFGCHPGVKCFTDCCRHLELVLTPYDVLRLRKNLLLPAAEFLDRYTFIGFDEQSTFPLVFLAMNEDSNNACPFVSKDGCKVYEDRPAACRFYPIGRASSLSQTGHPDFFHVLLQEPHCKGFSEPTSFSVKNWLQDQNLQPYIAFNDTLLTLMQHEKLKEGKPLTENQLDTYLQALYNLDYFRDLIRTQPERFKTNSSTGVDPTILQDDEKLLEFAVQWLRQHLFD